MLSPYIMKLVKTPAYLREGVIHQMLVEKVSRAEVDKRFRAARKWASALLKSIRINLSGIPEWDAVQAEIKEWTETVAELKVQVRELMAYAKAPGSTGEEQELIKLAKEELKSAFRHLSAAKERAVEIKTFYGISRVQSVVFNITQGFVVRLSPAFWAGVRTGQIDYVPGLAARLYYVAAKKTWRWLMREFTNLGKEYAVWKPEWQKHVPKDFMFLIQDVDYVHEIVQRLDKLEPKPDDPRFIKQGFKAERENRRAIESGLRPYFDYLDKFETPYGSIKFNQGPLPVPARKLKRSALKPDDKHGGMPRVAWAWAKHKDITAMTQKTNRPHELHMDMVGKGMRVADDLLTHREREWNTYKHVTMGPVLEIRVGNVPGKKLGPGLRFSADGSEFITFLNPMDLGAQMYRAAVRGMQRDFKVQTMFSGSKPMGHADAAAILAWWFRARYGRDRAKEVLGSIGAAWLIEKLKQYGIEATARFLMEVAQHGIKRDDHYKQLSG